MEIGERMSQPADDAVLTSTDLWRVGLYDSDDDRRVVDDFFAWATIVDVGAGRFGRGGLCVGAELISTPSEEQLDQAAMRFERGHDVLHLLLAAGVLIPDSEHRAFIDALVRGGTVKVRRAAAQSVEERGLVATSPAGEDADGVWVRLSLSEPAAQNDGHRG